MYLARLLNYTVRTVTASYWYIFNWAGVSVFAFHKFLWWFTFSIPCRSRIVFGWKSCTLYQLRLSTGRVHWWPTNEPRYCSKSCWKNRMLLLYSANKALRRDLVVGVGQPASVTNSWPLRRRAITWPCKISSVIGWSPIVVDVLTCVLSRLNLRLLQKARAASVLIFLISWIGFVVFSLLWWSPDGQWPLFSYHTPKVDNRLIL